MKKGAYVREADDGNNETERGKGFAPAVNSYTCHDANRRETPQIQ